MASSPTILIISFFFISTIVCCSKPVLKESLPIFQDKTQSRSFDHALYLIQSGMTSDGLDILIKAKNEQQFVSNQTLEKASLIMLEQGINSSSYDEQLLALWGVGYSGYEQAIAPIEKLLTSNNPMLQLASVHVLGYFDTDEAYLLLEKALLSNYFPIRIEALYLLSQKKRHSCFDQIYALFSKVDPEFRALFPRLFAQDGSAASLDLLKRLLYDKDDMVVTETVLAIGTLKNDSFIEDICKLQYRISPSIQEALLYSLGLYPNDTAKKCIHEIFPTKGTCSYLTKLRSEYKLGNKDTANELIQEAVNNNLYALVLLSELDDHRSEKILLEKLQSQDSTVRINAMYSLLKRKNLHALYEEEHLLFRTMKDFAVQPIHSPGRTLVYYQIIPSAHERYQNTPYLYEISCDIQKQFLLLTSDYPNKDFLIFANHFFSRGHYEFVPLLIQLLIRQSTEDTTQLLQLERERLGAPFIRAYANVALFQITKDQKYLDSILTWLDSAVSHPLIQPQPILPWRLRREESSYQLTVQERSQLLVDSCVALADEHVHQGEIALLKAMKEGSSKNRPLLAGLLLKMVSH